MKLAMVMIATVGMVGCGRPVLPTNSPQSTESVKPIKQLTDAEKLSLLNTEAIKRNLRWSITCFKEGNEAEQFLAAAEHIEATPGALYIEEGKMDEWIEISSTQADAAFALSQSIQGEPTSRAEHRKPFTLCLREKRGNWKYAPKVEAEAR